MKKVLAAALICAVSSFASWDYFEVIEDGKGEAEISFTQTRQGRVAESPEQDLRVRYSPMKNLELMAQLGYTLGVRYQIISVLSAGVDVSFPLPDTWGFTPNLQFHTKLTDALSLGTNFQMTIYADNSTDETLEKEKGLDALAGLELDLTLGNSVIYVGCDFEKGLTNSKDSDGNEISRTKAEGRGLGITPIIGYTATPGNLAVGTYLAFGLGGKDADVNQNENMTVTVGLKAAVKF